jgi:surfeit locus 1 family protein
MPFTLTFGTRRFRLRWPFLLLALAGCSLFTSLGFWQWGRGQYREHEWAAFEQAAKAPPQSVTGERLPALPRFTRVRVEGRYDGQHQFLLDNITRDGRPGYEILTPFVLADGSTVIVDRSWIASSGYRDRLPDIALQEGEDGTVRSLEGRLDLLPVPGVATGRVPPSVESGWPIRTSFPTREDLGDALGRPVVAVLALDGGAAARPPGFEPARNYSYAIQWWSFAGLTLLLFIVLNIEKRR